MINCNHLRHQIIRPVLKYLEPEIPYSLAAENLLLGTCAQESQMGHYLVQLGDGPARGIFQMEPVTHDDIFENFLDYRAPLKEKISALSIRVFISEDGEDDLIGNLYYTAAMARVHYYRQPAALPADNVYDLAAYWKKWYNTPLGRGLIEEYITNYDKYVTQ